MWVRVFLSSSHSHISYTVNHTNAWELQGDEVGETVLDAAELQYLNEQCYTGDERSIDILMCIQPSWTPWDSHFWHLRSSHARQKPTKILLYLVSGRGYNLHSFLPTPSSYVEVCINTSYDQQLWKHDTWVDVLIFTPFQRNTQWHLPCVTGAILLTCTCIIFYH